MRKDDLNVSIFLNNNMITRSFYANLNRSTIIDTLKGQSDKVAALAFFYFDFKHPSKQELSHCL